MGLVGQLRSLVGPNFVQVDLQIHFRVGHFMSRLYAVHDGCNVVALSSSLAICYGTSNFFFSLENSPLPISLSGTAEWRAEYAYDDAQCRSILN